MNSLSNFTQTAARTWNQVKTRYKPAINADVSFSKSTESDESKSSSRESELVSGASQPPQELAKPGASPIAPVATAPSNGVAPPVPSLQNKPVQSQPASSREQIVSAYADRLADIQGKLETCHSSASQHSTLQQAASSHVDAAIRRLPVAFGLKPHAIENWLKDYAGPSDKLACNLLSFLITELQSKGHGPDAAHWLFQQALTAGSTCLAAHAHDAHAQGQYLVATVEELRRVRQELIGPNTVRDLLAGLAQQQNVPLNALRDHVIGKKNAVNTFPGSDPDMPKAALEKEPQELELHGSSASVPKKRLKKGIKTNEGKQPKPGQLPDDGSKAFAEQEDKFERLAFGHQAISRRVPATSRKQL